MRMGSSDTPWSDKAARVKVWSICPKDPSLGFWYFFAGEASLELGDNDTALNWLRLSLAAMPDNNPLAHWGLAATYALRGNTTLAAEHAAEFRRIVPDARIAGLLKSPKRGFERGQTRRLEEGLALALAPSR